MSYDDTNIFAKILRGEIPATKVFEDEDFIVFMDVMPQAPGHTLVVPKAPSRNILDADPAVLAKVLPLVQKVARAVKTAFAADGVSIIQYNEPAGGQSVFHLHFHVIPRTKAMPLKPHAGEHGRSGGAQGARREDQGRAGGVALSPAVLDRLAARPVHQLRNITVSRRTPGSMQVSASLERVICSPTP